MNEEQEMGQWERYTLSTEVLWMCLCVRGSPVECGADGLTGRGDTGSAVRGEDGKFEHIG